MASALDAAIAASLAPPQPASVNWRPRPETIFEQPTMPQPPVPPPPPHRPPRTMPPPPALLKRSSARTWSPGAIAGVSIAAALVFLSVVLFATNQDQISPQPTPIEQRPLALNSAPPSIPPQAAPKPKPYILPAADPPKLSTPVLPIATPASDLTTLSLEQKQAYAMLLEWRDDIAGNNAAQQPSLYAPTVDRYYLRSNVSNAWIDEYLRSERDGGYRVTSLELSNILIGPVDAESITFEFDKLFTSTRDLEPQKAHSVVRMRLQDGTWLITYERDFKQAATP